MKCVVVLGAGRVSRPCVQHILKEPDVRVRVYDLDVTNARRAVAGHPRGEALALDATQPVGPVVRDADVVVNLLPAGLQLGVAEECVENRKPLVTACYVTDEIRRLDGPARDAGIPVLMEMGLDPGIDHMSAVSFIRETQAQGGVIKGFYSWCGAIPAAEANTNPFGYKFSWSPADLLNTARRPARFLRNGQVVTIEGDSLFENHTLKEVKGLGWFEEYPNGDCLRYIDIYGIPGVTDILRGTFRYIGWCETLRKMLDIGILDTEVRDLSGITCGDLTRTMIGAPPGADVRAAVAAKLRLEPYSSVMKRIEWLGLLGDRPVGRSRGSMRDVVLDLFLEKLRFEEGERDLIIMQHEYIIEYPATGLRKKHTSLFVDYGEPGGDTAIARTTGIPAGLGAVMILRGQIDLTGVLIPVHPSIYEPALKELAGMGMVFKETTETL